MEYAIGLTVVILLSALGLGFVIFVHELGHFLVAKLCGVKCEKFYLGFDIAGLKICKFQWGETEYGIGILPLGGYVKMLGQEDNPARMREEMERAKQLRGIQGDKKGDGSEAETASDSSIPGDEVPAYDPRSYLAQSVPKRMAIISAGVIMNVIFAFVMAVVAFSIGVRQMPCTVGAVGPGEAGWQADLRSGDEVLEIAGKKMRKFRDLQAAIQLADIEEGDSVPMLIRRPGVKEPFTVEVKPDRSIGAFIIGVGNGKTTRLMKNEKTWLIQKRLAVLPGSAAARAEPPLANGDRVVQIDDTPIDNYAQIARELAQKVDVPIRLVVERRKLNDRGKPTGETKRITSVVPPNPMRHLGVVMVIGEVTAIQNGSPAKTAGILPGDQLQDPAGDPMALPSWLRQRAGETVKLTLRREDSKSPIVVPVSLREPIDYAAPMMLSSPVASSSLGVAYEILNRVDRVIEGSPAAKAGLRPGDLITKATIIPPDDETLRKFDMEGQEEKSLEFSEQSRNWALFMDVLQQTAPGTKVKLTFRRQGEDEQSIELTPVDAEDWFNPDRGFIFEQIEVDWRAESMAEALAMGGRETLDLLTIVFRTLKALGTRKVSPRGLAGPITIVTVILQKADEGPGVLLLFLAFLSANLAVLNFLPIPVLDGGHFVLLAYEGIRGKPANEHVQNVLAYIGLAFILGLMIWVLGLDVLRLISPHG